MLTLPTYNNQEDTARDCERVAREPRASNIIQIEGSKYSKAL